MANTVDAFKDLKCHLYGSMLEQSNKKNTNFTDDLYPRSDIAKQSLC